MEPILYIVVPCYNEADVLPVTAPVFAKKIKTLCDMGVISDKSRVLFVDDGSVDSTWRLICDMSKPNGVICGLSLSRNKGHQNALLAGLMFAKDKCDITVSVDCDGQDDIDAIDEMIESYMLGSQVVYGIRKSRKSDSAFKRTSANVFYSFLNKLGVETVNNHADFRLLSKKVLYELENYKEVNLYLRGIIPLIGFKSSFVYYERKKRIAGKSKYSLRKMLSLAIDGITSLSVKPIRLIASIGMLIAAVSFIGIVWSLVVALMGNSVSGWASTVCIICFLGGIQLLSLGVIGEYIGKIYLETKQRPRYIISEVTDNMKN